MGWLILYTICFITSIIGLIIGNTALSIIGGIIICSIDMKGIQRGELQPELPGITYGLTTLISFIVHMYLYGFNFKSIIFSIFWGLAMGGLVSYVESIVLLLYFRIKEN